MPIRKICLLHSCLTLFPKLCSCICRRIVGIAHVEDLESIKDASKRAECERAALNCAKTILKGRRQFETIEQVIEHIQSFDRN
jgi:5-methylthioribose kinase